MDESLEEEEEEKENTKVQLVRPSFPGKLTAPQVNVSRAKAGGRSARARARV